MVREVREKKDDENGEKDSVGFRLSGMIIEVVLRSDGDERVLMFFFCFFVITSSRHCMRLGLG